MSSDTPIDPSVLVLLLARIKVVEGEACLVLDILPGLGEVILVLPRDPPPTRKE